MSEILVLAGVNGAGKSSVAGKALLAIGDTFYNPDRAARLYREQGLSPDEANARAWLKGKELLEHAIRERKYYAFERMAREHGHERLRETLASRLKDWRDPEITALLAKSRAGPVQQAILMHGVGPGFRRILASFTTKPKEKKWVASSAIYILGTEVRGMHPDAITMSYHPSGPRNFDEAVLLLALHDSRQLSAWATKIAEEYPAAAIVLLRKYLGTLADPEDLAPALTVPDPRVRELIPSNLHRVPSKSVSDVQSSNPQRRKRGRGRSV